MVRLNNLLLVIPFLLVSCGPQVTGLLEEKAAGDLITGQFLDSAVSGLDYKRASKDNDDTTDSSGSFVCKEGEIITFKLQNIILGEAVCATTITPIELVIPNRTYKHYDYLSNLQKNMVGNLLVLFQTLDTDGNPSNGIHITTHVKTLFEEKVRTATGTPSGEVSLNYSDYNLGINAENTLPELVDEVNSDMTVSEYLKQPSEDEAKHHFVNLTLEDVYPEGINRYTRKPGETTIGEPSLDEAAGLVPPVTYEEEPVNSNPVYVAPEPPPIPTPTPTPAVAPTPNPSITEGYCRGVVHMLNTYDHWFNGTQAIVSRNECETVICPTAFTRFNEAGAYTGREFVCALDTRGYLPVGNILYSQVLDAPLYDPTPTNSYFIAQLTEQGSGTFGYLSNYGHINVGQSFTTTEAGALDYIELLLDAGTHLSSPSDVIYCELTDANWNTIEVAQINGATFDGDGFYKKIARFQFAKTSNLTANTEYRFKVYITSTSRRGIHYANDYYSGGSLYREDVELGTGMQTGGTRDLVFKIKIQK